MIGNIANFSGLSNNRPLFLRIINHVTNYVCDMELVYLKPWSSWKCKARTIVELKRSKWYFQNQNRHRTWDLNCVWSQIWRMKRHSFHNDFQQIKQFLRKELEGWKWDLGRRIKRITIRIQEQLDMKMNVRFFDLTEFHSMLGSWRKGK